MKYAQLAAAKEPPDRQPTAVPFWQSRTCRVGHACHLLAGCMVHHQAAWESGEHLGRQSTPTPHFKEGDWAAATHNFHGRGPGEPNAHTKASEAPQTRMQGELKASRHKVFLPIPPQPPILGA